MCTYTFAGLEAHNISMSVKVGMCCIFYRLLGVLGVTMDVLPWFNDTTQTSQTFFSNVLIKREI